MASQADIEIAVEAAGADEAIDKVEQSEETLEDAGDSMSDTAGDMQDLNRQMAGLGRTLAATIAIAGAAILSQVPVVGEAFAGLTAIFEALMFQVDGLLRAMGVGGLSGVLFDISETIFELEGPLGHLAGLLALIAGVALAAFAVFAKKVGVVVALGKVFGGLVAAGKVLGAALLGLVSAITLPMVAVGLLIAALGLLIWYFEDEIRAGINTAIGWLEDFGSWLINDLPGILVDAANGIANWASGVAGDIADLAGDIADRFTDLVGDAAEWGKNLLLEFVDGILSRVNRLTSAIDDVAGRVRDRMPFSPAKEGPLSDLDDAGPGFIDTVAGGIEANVGQITQATENAAGAASDGSAGFNADRGSSQPVVRMDGRRLSQQDSRYRRDGTASRGRNG